MTATEGFEDLERRLAAAAGADEGPSPALRGRVMDAVRGELARDGIRRRSGRRLEWTLSAAAAILLALNLSLAAGAAVGPLGRAVVAHDLRADAGRVRALAPEFTERAALRAALVARAGERVVALPWVHGRSLSPGTE